MSTEMKSYSDVQDDIGLIVTEKGLERPAVVWARDTCAAYIHRYYPVHVQLNVLRTGSEDERKKMSAFIDACRAWSNQSSATSAELEKIKP
ncbi:hypothetical protein ACUXVY_01745 [Chromobacterium haemolyticum]|uniref:hypothetical protein n=1 Tax=Chromobacterium haemolyticum TaxID=394935 RepID=UPI0040574969